MSDKPKLTEADEMPDGYWYMVRQALARNCGTYAGAVYLSKGAAVRFMGECARQGNGCDYEIVKFIQPACSWILRTETNLVETPA